jgi:pyruvate dehydrogenase E1 component alpha subunit
MQFSIDSLYDSGIFEENLDLENYEREELITFLRNMVLIRTTEYKIAKGREEGLIGGPVHLGVGQEAIAAGLSHFLTKDDFVFGAHRSHSHLLALGGSVYKLFAEVLGRKTGFSKGRGGSMHLIDQENGFYGSVPIVAGTVPLAVGAALASRLKKSTNIAIAYLGDGACEEGVVHESLNLARINNEPIIFVVENNLFSSHMHISQRQPKSLTARFAHANDIEYKVVDGNNILQIAEIASKYVYLARQQKGPFFIEAITYRWFGHVDWREDIDVGIERSKEDIKLWRSRDPITRLKSCMIENKVWSQDEHEDLEIEIKKLVNKNWELALNDPLPEKHSLIEDVYS